MNSKLSKTLAITSLAALISACGSDSKSNKSENSVVDSNGQTYTITLEQTWKASDFPTNFPSNPHFSPLVGASHSQQTVIWRPEDQPTTPGIEAVAEDGRTGTFKAELETRQTNGTVNNIFVRGSGATSPGSQSETVIVTPQFPLVSAISMLAPSPDWFVGIRDLNLYPNGKWLDRIEVDLRLYDAGTEGGERFSQNNSAAGDRIIKLTTTDASDTDFENGVHRTSGKFVGKMILVRQP